MPGPDERDEKFVAYLAKIRKRGGAMADLRSGWSGYHLADQRRMFKYVEPWLPGKNDRFYRFLRPIYYLAAALFALHPAEGGRGNVGRHLADAGASDRLFAALLDADEANIPRRLRRAVQYLKSRSVAVNWPQLLGDLRAWHNPRSRARVIKSWRRAWERALLAKANE
jgi:CRISPR type I-E-associated protein CasB/Cse2